MLKLRCNLFIALVLAVLPLAASLISDGGSVKLQLGHTLLSVHVSSLAAIHTSDMGTDHRQDATDAATAAAKISLHEEQQLSDLLYRKSMRSSRSTLSPASPSLHSLGVQQGDKQFFVSFCTRTDLRTLVALHNFAGRRVIAHVQGGLYVAVGGDDFAAKARRFPGVAWVS